MWVVRYTLIEYMPIHLRDSHKKARAYGHWPYNGTIRVYVEGDIESTDLDEHWTNVIEDSIWELPENEHSIVASELPGEVWANRYGDNDE